MIPEQILFLLLPQGIFDCAYLYKPFIPLGDRRIAINRSACPRVGLNESGFEWRGDSYIYRILTVTEASLETESILWRSSSKACALVFCYTYAFNV